MLSIAGEIVHVTQDSGDADKLDGLGGQLAVSASRPAAATSSLRWRSRWSSGLCTSSPSMAATAALRAVRSVHSHRRRPLHAGVRADLWIHWQ